MDVAEHVTDDAELPLGEQSRVFREQVGWEWLCAERWVGEGGEGR